MKKRNQLTKAQVKNNPILKQLIEDIFNPKNNADYVKPWSAKGFKMIGHGNPVTKKMYRGGNAMITGYVASVKGYKSLLWITQLNMVDVFCKDMLGMSSAELYKAGRNKDVAEAKKKIFPLVKGEKYTNILFFKKSAYKKENEEGEEEVRMGVMWEYYNVMNLDQLKGKDPVFDAQIDKWEGKNKVEVTPDVPLSDAEKALIESMNLGGGVTYSDVDRACYSPTLDAVNMPSKKAFKSEEHAFSTLGHELAHSTGHASRLDRKMSNMFGGSAYAFEELIADGASALLDARFGVNTEEVSLNHVSYMKSWYKGLKDDPTKLLSAMNKAYDAYEFIMEQYEAYTNPQQQEEVA